MRKIVIIGATSAIAEACARLWAGRGDALHLLGRDTTRLAAIADDLRIRGAGDVGFNRLDANAIETHASALEAASTALGGIDIALIAHGTLPDQDHCDRSASATLAALSDNGSSTIALMTELANLLEMQGNGTLAVISSVAGDRGRASNAAYGTAKAAVTAYASALRQRTVRKGVHVLTIKPGLVDTPMTAGFRKGIVWAKADRVAAGIVRALDGRRNVVYLPWFWRPLMAVIRCLPESLFKRLRF